MLLYILKYMMLYGEGNGNLLHYACLGNPMNRGAWWAIVHGNANSTWLWALTRTQVRIRGMCSRSWFVFLSIATFSNSGPVLLARQAIVNMFSSVPKSCLTLCKPMDGSTPGFPFHHQLLELAQTHAHRVGDAIQPSPLHRPLHLPWIASILPTH